MTFDIKKFNGETVPKIEGKAVQVKGLERFQNFKATRRVGNTIITHLPKDFMIRYFFGCGVWLNFMVFIALALAMFDLFTGLNSLQFYFGIFFR